MNWFVGEGIVNKDKICIGGVSYGGYVVLMVVVKYFEIFKCVVSFVGVIDFECIVSKVWYFINKEIVCK